MNEAFQTEEKEKFAVPIIETSKQWFRNVSDLEFKQLEGKNNLNQPKSTLNWGYSYFKVHVSIHTLWS